VWLGLLVLSCSRSTPQLLVQSLFGSDHLRLQVQRATFGFLVDFKQVRIVRVQLVHVAEVGGQVEDLARLLAAQSAVFVVFGMLLLVLLPLLLVTSAAAGSRSLTLI